MKCILWLNSLFRPRNMATYLNSASKYDIYLAKGLLRGEIEAQDYPKIQTLLTQSQHREIKWTPTHY